MPSACHYPLPTALRANVRAVAPGAYARRFARVILESSDRLVA
jgi:hypothetical protein